MIVLDKVVKAFMICWVNDGCSTNCPYWKNSTSINECREKLAADVYSLLKEREPVKPIYNEEKYGDHLLHCGNCEKVLPDDAVYGKVNFCHYCGKSLM